MFQAAIHPDQGHDLHVKTISRCGQVRDLDLKTISSEKPGRQLPQERTQKPIGQNSKFDHRILSTIKLWKAFSFLGR